MRRNYLSTRSIRCSLRGPSDRAPDSSIAFFERCSDGTHQSRRIKTGPGPLGEGANGFSTHEASETSPNRCAALGAHMSAARAFEGMPILCLMLLNANQPQRQPAIRAERTSIRCSHCRATVAVQRHALPPIRFTRERPVACP